MTTLVRFAQADKDSGISIGRIIKHLPDRVDKSKVTMDDIYVDSHIEYDGGGSIDLTFTVKFPAITVIRKSVIRSRLAELSQEDLKKIAEKLEIYNDNFYFKNFMKFWQNPEKEKSTYNPETKMYQITYEQDRLNPKDEDEDEEDEDEEDEDGEDEDEEDEDGEDDGDGDIGTIISKRGYFTPEKFHEVVEAVAKLEK